MRRKLTWVSQEVRIRYTMCRPLQLRIKVAQGGVPVSLRYKLVVRRRDVFNSAEMVSHPGIPVQTCVTPGRNIVG